MRCCVGLIALTACGQPFEQELSWEIDHFEALFQSLDGSALPVVDVELDEDSVQSLVAFPRDWVVGRISLGGETYDVEVRLKGGGSFEPIDQRPSLKVKFSPDWHGYDVLVFNNYSTDFSKIHERLATVAYHTMGLPAARAGHTRVVINGEDRGIYGALEDVDDKFLRRWFRESDGALYELEDGDFQERLLQGIMLEEGEEDRSILNEIAADLQTGNVTGFDLAIEHFDREQFLSWWATTTVVGQTDAYPYSDPGDDAYIYLEPGHEQFHFIPHGLDEAFMPRGRTVGRINGMLGRRCLANPTCYADLVDHIDVVFEVLADAEFGATADELIRFSHQWGTPEQIEAMAFHHYRLRNWLSLRRDELDGELF